MHRISSPRAAPGAATAFACALLLCGGCGEGKAAPAANPATAIDAYERGIALLRERRFAEAEAALLESVGHDGEDAYAHYHLGVARYEQTSVMLGALSIDHAKLDQAIASLERAIDLDGGAASFHLYRGLALERGRALGAARTAFEEALRLDPSNLQARVHLGIVLLHEGDQGAAERELSAAIASHPESAVAYHQLGLVHLETSDWSAARDAFASATELQPGQPNAWFGLSNALRRLADEPAADVALAEFQRLKAEEEVRSSAMRAGPKAEALAHFKRGNELLQAGKDEEAGEAFRAVLALQPETGAAHANLGFVHLRLGETDKARHHLTEAVRLQPNNRKARDLLSQLDGVAKD